MSSGGNRPSSITRSIRDSFTSEMEFLPPQNTEQAVPYFNLSEELQDFEDEAETYQSLESSRSSDRSSSARSSNKNTPSPSSRKNSPKFTGEETQNIDPKIRKGLEKIRKLDKILLNKVEREREVKRERLALEKEFILQVQTLIEDRGFDNMVGYQQLLSLCAPVDTYHTDNNEEEIIEPIFATQIDSNYYQEDNVSERSTSSNKTSQQETENNNKSEKDKRKRSKDFVTRNIRLASKANEAIALTEEEKQRLEELLADDNDLLIGENPFSTPSITTDGFRFSIEEQQTLEDIDEKLKEYIPEDDYEAILDQSQSSISMSEKSSARTGNSDTNLPTSNESIIELTETECGERVLKEGHDQRTAAQRLNDIEQKLRELHISNDDGESTAQVIDPDLLRQLLDYNSRLTSDSKSICDSFQTNSEMYEGEIDVCSSINSQSVASNNVVDGIKESATKNVTVEN